MTARVRMAPGGFRPPCKWHVLASEVEHRSLHPVARFVRFVRLPAFEERRSSRLGEPSWARSKPPRMLSAGEGSMSIRTKTTFGAPAPLGGFNSNRGGGVALLASISVIGGVSGSGSGRIERLGPFSGVALIVAPSGSRGAMASIRFGRPPRGCRVVHDRGGRRARAVPEKRRTLFSKFAAVSRPGRALASDDRELDPAAEDRDAARVGRCPEHGLDAVDVLGARHEVSR